MPTRVFVLALTAAALAGCARLPAPVSDPATAQAGYPALASTSAILAQVPSHQTGPEASADLSARAAALRARAAALNAADG